jgi:hypothetical protein
MSVIRVGSTGTYAEGWEAIFGGGTRAVRKQASTPQKAVKKKAVKKKAASKKVVTKKAATTKKSKRK